MIDLFMPFRAFLKYENVCSDNNVFRMHYKVTVIMLLVFTLLVSSKQFFGEPIHCMSNSDKDSDKDAINSYCWIYGTYTLKSRLGGKEGINNAYVGVGPESFNDEQIKHTYYQWVCFVLLGQAVMFYTPRYLWKIWEGGRLKALAADLGNPMVSKDWSEFRRGELISYLTYTNIYTHNTYALRYALCELLNLANVVGQIFLLDIFLGGAFRNYGAAFAAFTHTPKMPLNTENFEIINPMDQFFPKLTKCWLRSYGPTGTLQLKDRLSTILLVAASAALAAPASSFSNANEIQEIHKDPTTHDLLASLGLKKLRVPAAHHRKRLAEQGRRHATGDSRMFVIKLPPNTSYYNNPEPAPAAARTLPLQMTGNGKPARVYHWNIPVLRKLAKNRPQARFDDDVVDVESTPTWPKGLNDHPNSIDGLAYYVPAKKTSFRKYFSGNGKPKSFYIIEKNKKTAEYHRLLP